MKKILFLSPLFLFLIMLLDGQLTTLWMNLAPYQIRVVSRLLLLSLIFFASQKVDVRGVLFFALIGFIYDSYYLNVIGVATTLFPVLASVLNEVFKHIRFNLMNFVLVGTVVIFAFEVLGYLMAQFFKIDSLGFEVFVVKTLAPTLFYNFLQSLVVYPICLIFLKTTRHKIVTHT